MLKLVISDLFVQFRRNLGSILKYFLIYFVLFLVSITIILQINAVFAIPGIITEQKLVDMASNEQKLLEVACSYGVVVQNLACANLLFILFLHGLSKKIPLRLNKFMFVAPAGEKEKMKFMRLQLWSKILFESLLTGVVIYFSVGEIFLNGSLLTCLFQVSLMFFLILNMNLRVGIGEQEERKSDKEGFAIYSKAEEVVNVYWFCLLLVEIILFYTLVALDVAKGTVYITIGLLVLASNVGLSIYCIRPILQKSISFEEIYRQRSE